jgi:GNAT superfamily N-acetyltransferase
MKNLKFHILTGPQLQPYINDIAALRISIFRDYPYLYDGDIQTEIDYLKSYSKSANSILVLVEDHKKVVGAVTGLPLAEVDETLLTPFEKNSSLHSIFYLGEILLLKEYRGKGVGHQMYRMFEDLVRQKKQFQKIAIAEVMRDPHDPRQPKNYISVHELWKKLGYARHPEMVIQASYKEIDSTEKIPHSLVCSLKKL